MVVEPLFRRMYFTSVYVTIRVLREVMNCTLPIEVDCMRFKQADQPRKKKSAKKFSSCPLHSVVVDCAGAPGLPSCHVLSLPSSFSSSQHHQQQLIPFLFCLSSFHLSFFIPFFLSFVPFLSFLSFFLCASSFPDNRLPPLSIFISCRHRFSMSGARRCRRLPSTLCGSSTRCASWT